jgi:hypothetical protein
MPAPSAAGRGRWLPAAPATATTIAEPEPYATDVRESDDEREHNVHTGVHTGLRQRPHRSTRGHLLLDPPPPAAPRHSVHIGVHAGLRRQRPHRSTRGHLLLDPPPPAAPRHLWTAVLGVRRRSAVERFRQSAASQRRPDPSDPVDPVVSANRTSIRPGPGALALARARPRPGPAASALARARPALVARVAAADVAEELDERVKTVSGRNGHCAWLVSVGYHPARRACDARCECQAVTWSHSQPNRSGGADSATGTARMGDTSKVMPAASNSDASAYPIG